MDPFNEHTSNNNSKWPWIYRVDPTVAFDLLHIMILHFNNSKSDHRHFIDHAQTIINYMVIFNLMKKETQLTWQIFVEREEQKKTNPHLKAKDGIQPDNVYIFVNTTGEGKDGDLHSTYSTTRLWKL